ncbi:hypothetical protein D7B24_009611 [Verticillium nonalfalfae]|uniref:NmrA-like domain-containing protein n=1 Tax=Verticillium nonalfalfae TaxID=1051616 RepID=A0A3M9Y492_9PEZI|nr:uncharacterized protein D7B24_009611 [Verticillium nonalfalfae]RNJ54596.1 hypothetical protein D7B24_009611 [Verticillium nonalfalfae]
MMRIAIAGAGWLSSLLTLHISQTGNPVLILSRSARPDFEADFDCQVAVVDYDDATAIQFALQGVDLVISTFRGPAQINLIHAARRAGVRHFVPAEFEGGLAHRPATDDPLDYGSSEALDLLRTYAGAKSRNFQWTVFSCGVFYERFGPGGLGAYGMGASSNLANQGDYLVNVGAGTADIVETSSSGRPVQVCLTSMDDLARFVAAAIELGLASWPREFKVRGDRLSTRDIFAACSYVLGGGLTLRTRKQSRLEQEQAQCASTQDWTQWHYIQQLRATADRRYDFGHANLNDVIARADPSVQPVGFRTWLATQWAPDT